MNETTEGTPPEPEVDGSMATEGAAEVTVEAIKSPWIAIRPSSPGFYRCWWTDGDGYDVVMIAPNGWLYFARHCDAPVSPEEEVVGILWDHEVIEFVASPAAVDAELAAMAETGPDNG